MVTIESIDLMRYRESVSLSITWKADAVDAETRYGDVFLPTRLHPVMRILGVNTAHAETMRNTQSHIASSLHIGPLIYWVPRQALYIDAGAAW